VIRRIIPSFFRVFAFVAGILCLPALHAFVLENLSWTRNRTVVMQLSLNLPRTLIDGSSSFNQVAQSALNIWNQYLVHLRLAYVTNSAVPPADNDEEMSVFFSGNVFGDSFERGTLAITLLSSRNGVLEETDTIFNTSYQWNSYRGPLRSGIQDFRRIAIHEFGHTLGLDHPDEKGQHVAAIMNSHISNLDTVQADDINGVRSLYNTGPAFRSWVNGPVLRNLSTRALIGTGESVLIAGFIIEGSQPATLIVRGIGYSLRALGITQPITDPMITIRNEGGVVVAINDDWFTSANAQTIASYHLDPANSVESAVYVTLSPGAYTAIVQGFSDSTQAASTGIGLVELYDLHLNASRAGNISSRGQVLTGQNVLIAGFIVGGTQSKQVVVRAIGPSLATAGVVNPLADPTLELRNANGDLVQSNNNWQQQNPNAQTISDRGLAPTQPRESALLATLNPGSYTAIVRGVANDTGTALVEVYDESPVP
jgi:predicted Zn-dependent protease